MKRHRNITIIILFASIILLSKIDVFAISKISTWTTPFGGRVISLDVPTVECPGAIGQGTAPVVLSSNLAGIARATIGSTGAQSAVNRVNNISSGIYRSIPLYTYKTSSVNGAVLKQPKVGDWILGRQYLVPNINVCETTLFGGVPFPVVKTDNYGVSR